MSTVIRIFMISLGVLCLMIAGVYWLASIDLRSDSWLAPLRQLVADTEPYLPADQYALLSEQADVAMNIERHQYKRRLRTAAITGWLFAGVGVLLLSVGIKYRDMSSQPDEAQNNRPLAPTDAQPGSNPPNPTSPLA